MVLDKLGESLRGSIDKLKKALFVDKKVVNEIIKDIQKALIKSDVNISQVMELSERIRDRALKENPPAGISKKDYMIKIVYEELVRFLGEDEEGIKIEKRPTQIMLVGLFGSGKTTQAGKLANYYKKRGYKVALVQTDTWRPAAYDQLYQLSNKIGVDFYGKENEKNPLKIYQEFKPHKEKYDVVIIDTAGRDALSDELIKELNRLNKEVQAEERILVLSGDIGQSAKTQAEAFHKSCNITGVIITKLDGTAKGGGALAACSATGTKVKFIGTGEKINDLERFNPKRFVGKLLGMGDIETLLEEISQMYEKEEMEDKSKKFLKGEFTLIDLFEQLEAVRKLGPLSKVVNMIPGMANLNIDKELLEVQESKIEQWKHALDSMTKEELEMPEKINASRIERISKGSGVPEQTIRELIKQYKQSKKLMKMVKGSDKKMKKMLSKVGLNNIPDLNP
ncbi:MAG: signal recognition particle subunit [Candidatus Woesearchaeota archaeon]|nr:signal recognition particle subunit [Candidatus Woesearchaeota archaeon]